MRVFEALGISEIEERLYVFLLEHPRITLAELARDLDLPRRAAQEAVRQLRTQGLVTETAAKPPRYIPAPPEAAVDALIFRRREELESSRLAAAQLAERVRAATERSRPADALEVIEGRQAVAQQFRQMQRAAQAELLVIDRPPYATPAVSEEVTWELDVLRRGVRCRTIYAREALEVPGKAEAIALLSAEGEHVRLLSEVSTKLAIADRRLALVPLGSQETGVEDAVLVHASFLLEALSGLFEALWERATPFHGGGESFRMEGGDEDRVLALLAAGLKDESIARALAISRSTVERRIRTLMTGLGAKTRFQAGLLAGRHLQADIETP
jgi:sugar-specific transcriptional regulator TrmB